MTFLYLLRQARTPLYWCRIAILHALNKHKRCNEGSQTAMDRKTEVMKLAKRSLETEKMAHR